MSSAEKSSVKPEGKNDRGERKPRYAPGMNGVERLRLHQPEHFIKVKKQVVRVDVILNICVPTSG